MVRAWHPLGAALAEVTTMVAYVPSSKPFQAVSFSGCGTLNFFQTGVAASLQRARLVEGMRFAGASAGSGLATLIAAGVDAEDICDTAIDILAPFAGENILRRPDIPITFARRFLGAFVDEEILARIGDRVHISITTVAPLRNWTIHRFRDVDDLCGAIRASCHIPSWRHRAVRFRGSACVDGGFTSNTPLVGDRCLTVSPFATSRRIDITPAKPLNPLRAFVIPGPDRARSLFERGRVDGQRYLDRVQRGVVALKPKKSKRLVVARAEPAASVYPGDLPAHEVG